MQRKSKNLIQKRFLKSVEAFWFTVKLLRSSNDFVSLNGSSHHREALLKSEDGGEVKRQPWKIRYFKLSNDVVALDLRVNPTDMDFDGL
ncbi:hypothetical protein ACFX2J_017714 [Malus domestica]